MSLIAKLLRKNTSFSRIAGFALSNFIGLLIIGGAAMFYVDSRAIWADDESVVNTDYLVLNKKVTSASTLGDRGSTRFSENEVTDLKAQPWVRRVGEFSSSDFRVYASVSQGGRGMETALFFESVPDSFVDLPTADWRFEPGQEIVPVMIPKDYLALYNFGFAGSAGLPQLSEQLISGIPLKLYMRSEDGARSLQMEGRIAGFSNRLNTVLVPDAFMQYANSRLGEGAASAPSRLIVDVSSPGDTAISDYLSSHGLEVAGDKSGSSAAFLLKLVVGIVMAIGAVITLLSLFVLMLSVSLLMEKNRQVIHSLLMLGAPLGKVGAPYSAMILTGCAVAWVLSIGALIALRSLYAGALEGLGGVSGGLLWGLAIATALALIVVAVNIVAVRRKIKSAWSLRINDAE
ncbi:MAG: ABC transporter permease [Muribaculaceae bacterium]|nr:ABC transporter permease [Muribaculaceae bacterium]